MDILNTHEKLESLKQKALRRYRHIQCIEKSKRDVDDLVFLENLKAAARMWGWNLHQEEELEQKQQDKRSKNT